MNRRDGFDWGNHVTIAMIDDKEVEYDVCSEKRYRVYSNKVFRYIGKGVIHKVNDVLQTFTRKHYFWVYR